MAARVRASSLRRRVAPSGRDNGQVQDAIVDFLRGAPRLTVESGNQLRALLAPVVDNNIRDRADRFRGRRRQQHAGRPLPADGVLRLEPGRSEITTPSRAASSAEWQVWARLAMELVVADDRRILVLPEQEDLSSVELGERCGMTPNPVRMKGTRAVARLADRITGLRRGHP